MTHPRIRLLLVMSILIVTVALAASLAVVTTGDLVMSGVVDRPLTGGTSKAIELYVVNNIADVSIYGVGSVNDGGGSDGEEFTLPAGLASAGDLPHVASESAGFATFFGFTSAATSSPIRRSLHTLIRFVRSLMCSLALWSGSRPS